MNLWKYRNKVFLGIQTLKKEKERKLDFKLKKKCEYFIYNFFIIYTKNIFEPIHL